MKGLSGGTVVTPPVLLCYWPHPLFSCTKQGHLYANPAEGGAGEQAERTRLKQGAREGRVASGEPQGPGGDEPALLMGISRTTGKGCEPSL